MTPLATMISSAAAMPVGRARLVVSALAATESGWKHASTGRTTRIAALEQLVALAFERGMKTVRAVLVQALREGDEAALRVLRGMLPRLLRVVNEAPVMAIALAQLMAVAIDEGPPVMAAEVTFNEDHVVGEALGNWRERTVMESDLGSAELRGMAAEIRNRAIFSARTTNAEYLQEVGKVVDGILSGDVGMSEGRWLLMKKLKEMGYDPETGFPDDFGRVPPAERDSLQDLSSRRRLDLLLETNVRMAQGYAMTVHGNTETSRYAYPGWELVRLYPRDVPRGTPESRSVGWARRWEDAGESVLWEGAAEGSRLKVQGSKAGGRMVALKDSAIWAALGDGAGGYTDTLLNGFPPFAFRSGLGWRSVPRAECVELGLVADGKMMEGQNDGTGTGARPAAVAATLTPGQREVARVVDSMPADLRAELLRELGLSEGGLRV